MSNPALPACVINCAVYDRHGKRADITLDAISDALAVDDDSFVWVGLYEPEDAILDKLQEEFNLHDLAVEDAQNAHQRPKIEAYGHSLFVAVHTAQVVDDKIAICVPPTTHESRVAARRAQNARWAQVINASLGRVLVRVSSSRGFVEGVR